MKTPGLNTIPARLPVITVLALGLLLRVIYLLANIQNPDFRSPVLDPQLNDYWARALVTGDWVPPPHADDPEIKTTPYGRPPAYPWLLAGIYRAGRGSYLAPRLVQIAAGLLNIFLVFLLGRRLSGNASGIIASFLMAVFWAAVYFEGELNSPVWEACLALGMVLCLLHWTDTKAWRWLAAAGLLLGVGVLMRPNTLLPGSVILAWVVWHAKKERMGAGSVITTILVYLGMALLVIAPVIIRNWVVGGQFVFISYYGGINAYIGNNPHSGGASPAVPDLYEISGVEEWNCFNYPSIVRGLAHHLKKPGLGFSGTSRYFYKRALLFWRETPLQALVLTLRKAWLFWGPHEISDSKVIHYERLHSNVLSRLPRFSLLLALALTGLMVCVWSNKSRDKINASASALSLLFVLGYFFSILPFFISERYRFPVVPFLLPFAGFAVVQAWERLRQKEIKQVLLVILGFTLCYGVVTYPLLPYTPDYSAWYLHRGLAHAAQGDMRDAEAAFEQALRENPDNDEAHLQLGYIHAMQGLKEDAMEHYRRALEADPGNAFAANNLGYELYLKGAYAEAEQYYRQVLERYPIYTLALNNLGNALLREGRPEEALACFEKVLGINPRDPFARYNIGNVHLETGAYDKAVDTFRKAFEEQPFNPDIANNLGLALAHSGRLEESIAWFEKALDLSRNYPLAHFNLGNVYGYLGDLELACCHYEQVLTVWPEHVEARERYQLLCGSLPIP